MSSMMINMLIRVPEGRVDIAGVLTEAGYPAVLAALSVVIPGSFAQGGKDLIQCGVEGDFDEIERVCDDNGWEIYAAQNILKTPNPDWNPRDEDSEREILVVYVPMKSQTWAHMKDRDDGQGGTIQQTQVHNVQGWAAFPLRPRP